MVNCIGENASGYDEERRISNARFDLRPALICHCTTEQEVGDAIRRATAQNPFIPIRIRAGGHHHEGMCSGNGVLMIDIRDMADIDLDTDTGIVRVGPGARNGKIYDQLWFAPRGPHRVFPGGGCGDVAVGGFLQGGGWGPFSRQLGMGCDRIAGFRIVMRDGEAYDIQENDPDSFKRKLYWAVCGAGGGNFGVVTEYRIRTAVVESPLSTFTVSWDDPRHRRAVIEEWRRNFPGDHDTRLTSFCRVTTVDPNDVDPPVLIGGNCLAGADAVVRTLERLLPNTIATASTISVSPVHKLRATGFTHPEYQPGPPPAALKAVAGAGTPNLADTCAGNPFPHKVSSCFPSGTFDSGAVEKIVSYIETSTAESMARRYLSLHSMGGAIRNEVANSFAWRDKPFMLQYQAWWLPDRNDPGLGDRCMEWLTTFRDQMRGARYTEGSFINFPDRDIPIEDYYGHKFATLKQYKDLFDIDGVFDFEMGIPRR